MLSTCACEGDHGDQRVEQNTRNVRARFCPRRGRDEDGPALPATPALGPGRKRNTSRY